MQKIVSSLASILATFGISKGDRVHVDPRYMDSAAMLARNYGEHPYSFRLGSASGSDGDIPGRIFSFCSGGIVLTIFPIYGNTHTEGDSWEGRTSQFCLHCAAAEAKKNPDKARRDGVQCRAACFYISQDSVTVHRGEPGERMENVLHVAIPG